MAKLSVTVNNFGVSLSFLPPGVNQADTETRRLQLPPGIPRVDTFRLCLPFTTVYAECFSCNLRIGKI